MSDREPKVTRAKYSDDLPCMHAFGEACDCWKKREQPTGAPRRTCECGEEMEYTGTMGTVDPRPTFHCSDCGIVKVVGPEPTTEELQKRTDDWCWDQYRKWRESS